MPVFYFNVRDGAHLVKDEAGSDFPDISLARDCALRFARNAVADKIERGEIIGDQVFEICDKRGTVMATASFRDVLLLE